MLFRDPAFKIWRWLLWRVVTTLGAFRAKSSAQSNFPNDFCDWHSCSECRSRALTRQPAQRRLLLVTAWNIDHSGMSRLVVKDWGVLMEVTHA
jgi:hypothetical protein